MTLAVLLPAVAAAFMAHVDLPWWAGVVLGLPGSVQFVTAARGWLRARERIPLLVLRGHAPTFWFSSPSHGLVGVVGTTFVTGRVSAELDPHAPHSVASISYDDARHALLVQIRRVEANRQHATLSRELISLERSMSAADGLALAKRLLALSVR